MESVFRECGVEGEERRRGYRKAVVLLFLFSDALDIISIEGKNVVQTAVFWRRKDKLFVFA